MTQLWLVRAERGTLTERFIEGGYVAIGWDALGDLSDLRYRDTLVNMVNDFYPDKGRGSSEIGPDRSPISFWKSTPKTSF